MASSKTEATNPQNFQHSDSLAVTEEFRSDTPSKSGMMQLVGSTGLKQSGGFVYDEFLRALQGSRSAQAFREIAENSPIAAGIILGYQQVAGHLDWKIEEHPEATSKDKAAFDFITEAFDDTDEKWDSTLSQIMSQIIFGWSWHEVIYKKRNGKDSQFTDGKITWKSFPIRAQESLYRWDIDETGKIKGMIQQDPVTGKQNYIPSWKSLHFRTTEMKNNPEGRSLLRSAYIPYQYVRRIQEYEAIGVERDLAGLPTLWLPADWLKSDDPATIAAVDKMTQMVKDVRRNEREGLILPMMYEPGLTDAISRNKALDFELMSSAGGRQFDTGAILERYNQQIGMSLLADFLTLGHDGVGSFALGTAKLDLWIMVVDSLCKSVAEIFNKHAIEKLLKLNGIDFDHAPKLVYGQVENVDLGVLGQFISQLATAGMLTPDAGLETWLREKADMPPTDVEGVMPPAAITQQNAEEDRQKMEDAGVVPGLPMAPVDRNGDTVTPAQGKTPAAAKPKPGAKAKGGGKQNPAAANDQKSVKPSTGDKAAKTLQKPVPLAK